jgi:hypothetical protein
MVALQALGVAEVLTHDHDFTPGRIRDLVSLDSFGGGERVGDEQSHDAGLSTNGRVFVCVSAGFARFFASVMFGLPA